jgi:hypothetical protein
LGSRARHRSLGGRYPLSPGGQHGWVTRGPGLNARDYPLLGEIEEAIVLAQQLQAAQFAADALASYDLVRRERVGKMARMTAANRDARVAGPVAARLHKVFMPVFFGRFYERATAWLSAV